MSSRRAAIVSAVLISFALGGCGPSPMANAWPDWSAEADEQLSRLGYGAIATASSEPVLISGPTQVHAKDHALRKAVRVAKGDTLFGLAKAHRTTIAQLMQLNGLRGPTIRSGQIVYVN